MNNPTFACLLLLLGGCGVTGSVATSPELQAQLIEAEKRLDAGDPHGALQITDEVLEEHPRLRRANLIAARANVALAGAGSQGKMDLTASLLADAARNFEIALQIEADDTGTLLQLARVYQQQDELELARDTARKAAGLCTAPEQKKVLGEALLATGDAELRIMIRELRSEKREEGGGFGPRTLAAGQAALVTFASAKKFEPGPAFLKSSYVFAYLGKTLDELRELEKGIRVAADHFPLHTRLRQVRAGRGEQKQLVAWYRQSLRDDGPNASINFALGQTQSELADKLRQDGDREGAQSGYLAAIQSFESCRDAKPEWKDTCDHWIAIEYIALAHINQQAGNLAAGKEFLKKAWLTTPRVLERGDDGLPVIRDTMNTTYEGTLSNLGQAIAAKRDLDALRDGMAFWVEFTELHPGKLGWVYNNAAFTARDLGTMIEARGRQGDAAAQEAAAKEAMAIYEKSFELYQTAVKLSPDDARTINDAGLMLIYHLHREYPRAKAWFEEAIRVGTGQLADMPEDTPVERRQLLEEAVGDAWQNLAKMARDANKPFADYEDQLKKAVQYYPYQQRQAAHWLRAKGEARPVNASNQGKVDPRAAAFAQVRDAAQKKADAQDFDGALLELDKVGAKMTGFAPFHYLLGRCSYDYALQSMARGGNIGQIDGLLADARSNLQKAVELDGEQILPRLYLSLANYQSKEFVNAAKIAEKLLSHISSRGGTTDDLLAAAHRARASAGYQVYVAAKQAQENDTDELTAARNSFRALESMNRLDAEVRGQWSMLERWAGDNAGALDIFVRALARKPDDQAVLGEVVEAAKATNQSATAVRVLGKREDALGLWYRGKAHSDAAFQAPANATPDGSLRELEAAIGDYKASAAKNADYAGTCRELIATCQAYQGFVALDAGRHADAEPYFLAAAKTAPERATTKVWGERSVKTGIELIVHHHYSQRDLPAAIETLKKATAVLTEQATLWNNLGLFARDHGNQLERRGGDKAAAKEFYELSYTAYKNSVRLSPTIRQKNDLAVILLYHVHRELDWATKALTEAAAEGEKKLAEAPPEDPQELQDLQEAVGDCYENLGYYHLHHDKDDAKARKYLETSLKFYPGQRRAGRRWLRDLDRKDGK